MMDAVQCSSNHRQDHTKELGMLKTVANDHSSWLKKAKIKSFLKERKDKEKQLRTDELQERRNSFCLKMKRYWIRFFNFISPNLILNNVKYSQNFGEYTHIFESTLKDIYFKILRFINISYIYSNTFVSTAWDVFWAIYINSTPLEVIVCW